MKKIIYWTTYETFTRLQKQCARMTLVNFIYMKEAIHFDTTEDETGRFSVVTEETLDKKISQLLWQGEAGQSPIIEPLTAKSDHCYTHIPQASLYQRYEKIIGVTTDTKDEITITAHLIEKIAQPTALSELNQQRVMVELKTSGTIFPKFIQAYKKTPTKAGA